MILWTNDLGYRLLVSYSLIRQYSKENWKFGDHLESRIWKIHALDNITISVFGLN